MNFSNVRDALSTKGIELRKAKAFVAGKMVDAYVLDTGIEDELKFLPVADYDILDVYHEGLRLN